MIIKKREIPLLLLQLKALQSRLPPDHPQTSTVESDEQIYHSGHRGEASLDYYLQSIDHRDTYILHSVRLKSPTPFQIDTLILTPHFILIVEAKNFVGQITFDHHFGQMKRVSNGVEKPYKDPITQVETQAFHLQNWLMNQGFSGIPVETLVVFTSNHVQLNRTDGLEVDDRIIRSSKLIERITHLKQTYRHPEIHIESLRKLSERIKKDSVPLQVDVLNKYQISYDDLIRGVICPNCRALPMKRIYGNWLCEECSHQDKNAHLNTLKEFQLLFKNTISNREARWFMDFPSIEIMSKLLNNANLEYQGERRHRVYRLDYDPQKEYHYLMKNKKTNSKFPIEL